MKTVDDIKYEINFIEKELANKEFTYLSVNELQVWLKALNWTLEERLVW
jgi:hypothetical protein